jgi:hypothetical protein
MSVDELCSVVDELAALVNEIRNSMVALERRCGTIEDQVLAVAQEYGYGDIIAAG